MSTTSPAAGKPVGAGRHPERQPRLRPGSGLPGPRGGLTALAPPLAAYAAMASFALQEVDPLSGAESGFLARIAAGGLLAVAALAPAPGREVALGSVLAAAAVWSLPAGSARGAAIVLLVLACLSVAAARRLSRCLPALPFAVALPLCLGLQVLIRGNLLLVPVLAPRPLVVLLGLPVVAAAALAWLAHRHGGERTLLAGAAALLIGPGWSAASTAALVAVAAASALLWPLPLAEPPARRLPGGLPARWLVRAAAVAVLLALIAWTPRAGLAVTASRISPGPVLVIAALALAAVAVRPHGATSAAMATWATMLVGGTALAAAYPWLREQPLGSVLSWAGLLGTPVGIGFAAALLAAVALAERRRLSLAPRWAAALAGALALGAMAVALPRTGAAPLPAGAAVLLDAGNPSWQAEVAAQPVRSVVVESALDNSGALAPGTPVATVRLEGGPEGGISWTLAAGRHTGEWAARRPDVAAASSAPPPPAWISYVAGDFFGQRYRAVLPTGRPGPFTRLRVERAAGLPPEVGLALHGLELRP